MSITLLILAYIYTLDQKISGLKASGTYENITIDTLSWNNWTWAENQEWCSGLGTFENPYSIQGHTLGVKNFKDGIKVSNSNDVYFTIRNCTVFWNGSISTGMETGISILNSTKGTIINNTIHSISSGIRIVKCEDIDIVNNKVYSAMAGIYLILCDFCVIEENIAFNTDNGIFLSYCENTILRINIAYNNEYGIFLADSNSNEIIGNTVDNNNNAGIKLYYSNFNNITSNDSKGNLYDGIQMEEECENNRVLYNDFSNNNIGIEIYYSNLNYISNNIANNNDFYGIRLEVCGNNTVTKNIVKNNTQYGMYVEMGSDNNSFIENFFLQNGIHAFDEGLNNIWNSTTIGNYWDNHTGPDTTPQDGIVDEPYTFIAGSSGSVDYYPIAEDGAPRITIHSPSAGTSFGSTAPSLNVEVIDSTPVEMWYTLDGGLHNYTFYYLIIEYYIFPTFLGFVDQSAWDAKPDGSVTITFYAVDVAGNMAHEQVSILKDTSGGNTPGGLDPGVVVGIIVISVVSGFAIIGTAYFYLKKRRSSS